MSGGVRSGGWGQRGEAVGTHCDEVEGGEGVGDGDEDGVGEGGMEM